MSQSVWRFGLMLCVLTAWTGFGQSGSGDLYMKLVREALAYMKFNAWEEVLEASDQAIQMSPDRTHAWETRAKALLELGQYDEARSAYERLAGLMPETRTTIIYNIGEVYFREGKFEEALQQFKQYVQREDDARRKSLGEWKILLCNLKVGNRDAASQYVESLEPQPFEPLFYYARAAQDYADNAPTEAKRTLIKANRIYNRQQNEMYAEGLVHLGWLNMDELNSEFFRGSPTEYQIEDLTARAIQGGMYYADPTGQPDLSRDTEGKEKPSLPELPALE